MGKFSDAYNAYITRSNKAESDLAEAKASIANLSAVNAELTTRLAGGGGAPAPAPAPAPATSMTTPAGNVVTVDDLPQIDAFIAKELSGGPAAPTV